MACLSLLSAIGIQCLSVIFGENSSKCLAHNWRWAPLTIRKPMGKQKSSIVALSNIFTALHTSNPISGIHFFHGLSFGIILPIMPLQEWLPSKLSMEGRHPQYLNTMKVSVQFMKSTKTWLLEMLCYNSLRAIYSQRIIEWSNRPIPNAETLNSRSVIWYYWSYIPTASNLYSKEPIKSLQADSMGHIQLKIFLETLFTNSSFPTTLAFTSSVSL